MDARYAISGGTGIVGGKRFCLWDTHAREVVGWFRTRPQARQYASKLLSQPEQAEGSATRLLSGQPAGSTPASGMQ